MKEIIFQQIMSEAETRDFVDGTQIMFFPNIKRALFTYGDEYRWITATSLDLAEATYHMDMDAEALYG